MGDREIELSQPMSSSEPVDAKPAPHHNGANHPEKLVTVRECPKADRDIEIAYDTFGDASKPAVLLVMGMNAHMILWPDEFCVEIANRGFFVIRFDNRDCGRSTKLPHMPTPSICNLVCLPNCCAGKPGYTLEDFADDAVALLDTLSVTKAHIVGQSMGGMIVQCIALKYPQRVLSMWSIFSTPCGPAGNDKRLVEPTLKVKLALGEKPKDDTRAEYQRNFRDMGKIAFFPPEHFDTYVSWIDDINGRIYDRGVYTEAITRHAATVVRQESRVEALKAAKFDFPVLVLHGAKDVLVDPSHGLLTHECIAGSVYVVVPDMAHSILPCHIGPIVDHWQRVCAPATGAAVGTPKADALPVAPPAA